MERFGELLFEAITDTTRQVLGETALELICSLVERQGLRKRGEVDERVEVFCAFLERLLGSEGARLIQASSLRRLCLRLRREYEEIRTYFSLLDKLYEVKCGLLFSSSEQEVSVCN